MFFKLLNKVAAIYVNTKRNKFIESRIYQYIDILVLYLDCLIGFMCWKTHDRQVKKKINIHLDFENNFLF